jgi:hypothetical protein
MKSIKVDDKTYADLRAHKEKTGVPIGVAMKQAVELWLKKK